MRNIALGLITLSLAAAYLVATLDVPRSLLDGPVGARGFPNLIGWTLVCASVLLISRSILGGLADGGGDNDDWSSPRVTMLRAAGFAGIAISYLLVMPLLGYALSTFLLIALGVQYQERRAPWWGMVVAGIGALVFWLLFVKLLGIPLPVGVPGQWF